jgi:hypothetical protein
MARRLDLCLPQSYTEVQSQQCQLALEGPPYSRVHHISQLARNQNLRSLISSTQAQGPRYVIFPPEVEEKGCRCPYR